MQGSDTTASILAALGRIAEVEEHFDAVVIIRGGGAVSELRALMTILVRGCCTIPLTYHCGHRARA